MVQGEKTTMIKSTVNLKSIFTLAIVMAATWAGGAIAQEGEGYWKGKQIRLIVGTAPGGGYDSYARLVAGHLSKHLPGKPSIVVQNMPGAGSLVLVNHLNHVAPRDGTVIAAVHSLSATYPLLFPDRAKYDGRELRWIGSTLRENHVGVAWHTSPVSSFEDVLGAGGATNSFPALRTTCSGRASRSSKVMKAQSWGCSPWSGARSMVSSA
jgi:tripartite-type tricarboxylate transporter receptor subunit TctC